MKAAWERFKVPTALALITSFTVHLLWYPIYGGNLAAFGDQHSAQLIRRWYLWNPVFIVLLVSGGAILYGVMRESDERSPLLASVASATVVLAVVVLELILIAAYGYLRYALFRA